MESSSMRAISRKTKSLKRTHKAHRETAFEPSTNRHKPAKVTRNRVPAPQRELIVQMSAAGTSIKNIAQKVHRNRETVSRIVHGPEMQDFLLEMRQRYLSLAPDAIGAVQHALTKQNDGRLGFQFLASIGVPASPPEKMTLTPPQTEIPNDEAARVEKIISDLIKISAERAATFGFREPQLEEDLRKVGGQIDYSTGKIKPLNKKPRRDEGCTRARGKQQSSS
jgi:hypothetical protein